ncbi:FtsX-like permease family protein [bacterium]|nr:MAG: FtsX-like permease family protein [bacterium]
MRKAFFVRLALLNTFKKRLRALLAIGGIALTTGVMIVLFGVEIGLHNMVNGEVANGDSKDVVTVNQRNVQQIKLDTERLSKIQSISGVSELGSSVGLVGAVVYHGINLDLPLYGVSPEYLAMSSVKPFKGTIEGQPDAQKVVVTKKVLEVLSINANDAVGKKLQVGATLTKDYASKLGADSKKTKVQEYEIVGVVDKGSSPVIYMPIEQLRTQGLDGVAQLKARLTSPEKVPAVRESIEQMGLQTTSILDTMDQINKLFQVIQNVLLIFGIVVFVITVSGTFTIITLTLMEETRQIGFLRIMGLRRRDVRTLFVIQSIVLTFLGAFFGIIFGLAIGFVLNGVARALASTESFATDISIFVIPVQPIIIILMLAILIGWLVGLLPAKRAVLINPLEEIR